MLRYICGSFLLGKRRLRYLVKVTANTYDQVSMLLHLWMLHVCISSHGRIHNSRKADFRRLKSVYLPVPDGVIEQAFFNVGTVEFLNRGQQFRG